MFSTLLIANRGEIACRIIRTCARLGIRTIAVYSDADTEALHVRMADQAVPIGGAAPKDSYLRADAILAAAKASGAEAIHPGYGFLSENADFAEAVEAAGLVFVGPSASSMRKMGSKAGAKDLMQAAGVPVVPGYTGDDQSPECLRREAERIGFPLMIKAAHGGGGKGMRIVQGLDAFDAALASCQREAKGAFGRDRVLLERYITTPRHIEFQIFADRHGHTLHLGERECSAQRRYQKVIEESPSPFLDADRRARMGKAAVAAARAIGYRNAGTVEFIVADDGEFWFMEINTRLQVEHPVTEMVTGLDLVEWQLRVAAGEALPETPPAAHGHAIEVRLYAEDPERDFLPGSGRLEVLRLPRAGDGVRIDAGVEPGDVVSIHYDPMIGKLIVHADDRPGALARMRQALAECEVVGPGNNIAFLEHLIAHPKVQAGDIDTGFLDRHLDSVLPAIAPPPREILLATVAAMLHAEEQQTRARAAAGDEPDSPWAMADGWRLGHAGQRVIALAHRGSRWLFTAHGSGGDYRIELDGDTHTVDSLRHQGDWLSARVDARALRLRINLRGVHVLAHDGRQRWNLQRVHPWHFEGEDDAGSEHRVLVPMPGKLALLHVAVGDAVEAGAVVAVMEAMKMELSLKAPRGGVIAAVRAQVGEFVEADTALILLEHQA